MSKKPLEVFISSEQISRQIAITAKQLRTDYLELNPLFLVVLKGSFLFAADLIRAVNLPSTVEFISCSSYLGTDSCGQVAITDTSNLDLTNRHVIVIEDIVDTGHTLSQLLPILEQQQPASLKVVALLDKPSRRIVTYQPDYTCFVIPDHFVVGYGLDYQQQYRQLPYLAILTP